MKCLSPIRVHTEVYGKMMWHDVPCGKCMACLSRKRAEWLFRCKQEMKVCKTCYFVTLTYDPEHVPYNDDYLMVLDKRDVQLFFKRLRKKYPDNNIRYFLCGEYSPDVLRPHYHALIWNLPEDNSPSHIKTQKLIEKAWQNGIVHVGDDVSGGAINYCAKYCLTPSYTPESLPKPFILTSRRPGIGANYVTAAAKRYHKCNNLVAIDGHTLPLPRFYKNKLETREESEMKYKKLEWERNIEEARKRLRNQSKTPEELEKEMYNEYQAQVAYEYNTRKHLLKTRKKV